MKEQKQQDQAGQLIRMDPQALIQQAISSGSGVETMERLVALAKDIRAEQAREAWYSAMAEFQRLCPRIVKDSSADIQGKYKYKYASLDTIMATISPILGPLGLSVAYRQKPGTNSVSAVCIIRHALGHTEESGEVTMPVEQGAMGANGAQRIGMASTYARRYALMAALGLAPEDDTDGAVPNHGQKPPVSKPRPVQPAEVVETADWRATDPDVFREETTVREVEAAKSGKKWRVRTDTGNYITEDPAAASYCQRFAEPNPKLTALVSIEYTIGEGGRMRLVSLSPIAEHPSDEPSHV